MIRQAVGAIIKKDGKYLLVNKVRSTTMKEAIIDHWDFPKGGLDESDINTDAAVMRELKEETGSSNYHIVKKYKSKICFTFPVNHKYSRQETTMYLLEFSGKKSELKPDGKEIASIQFYDKNTVIAKIKMRETKEFLNQNIW